MTRATDERVGEQHPRSRVRPRAGERGYVLVSMVMLLVALMLAVGFATDVGAWYAQASRQQRAADAAALAAVAWLPDTAKAAEVARSVAAKNGFDSADGDIDVQVDQAGPSGVQVTITDTDGPLYFSKLALDTVTIKRAATAESVRPVPLGSPRNYFGTGDMVSGTGRESFWAAVNGWCSPREQGDPFAPGYEGNPTGGAGSCPWPTPNRTGTDFPHYRYRITVPAVRVDPIVIHLYSPRATGADADPPNGQGITFRAEVRSPDDTIFDDSDNPLADCSGTGEQNPKTFAPLAPGGVVPGEPAPETILGRPGWVRVCTIPASAPAGDYLLGVGTLADEFNESFGYDAYSVLASYNGNGSVCDSRTDSLCPRVAGVDWMSIMAQSGSSDATFYLAEVSSAYAGKQVEVTVFDPGEGGEYVELLDPNGVPMSFSFHTQDGLYSGGPTTRLDVSGCRGFPQVGPGRSSQCRFNERFVVLTVDVPTDYVARYGNKMWWSVHYRFLTKVTDRSTWSVRVAGDPIRLVR